MQFSEQWVWFINCVLYKWHLKIIWIRLICSNFIIPMPNVKELLAQHIPLLGYTSLSFSWEIFDGFTKPLFRDTAVSLMDIQLCRFFVSAEIPCPIKHNAACRFWLFTNCRQPKMNICMFNVIFIQEPRSLYLPMLIAFHFSSLFHALRPLEMVMKQQFFFSQACKTRAIWWWNNVLPVYYHIITWAILQLVICWNSSPFSNRLRTHFVGHLRTLLYGKCKVTNNNRNRI